jgi:hypothetical protein
MSVEAGRKLVKREGLFEVLFFFLFLFFGLSFFGSWLPFFGQAALLFRAVL